MPSLEERYRERHHDILVPLAHKLYALCKEHLRDVPRIDRISTRAKRIDRFLDKAAIRDGNGPKYTDPLEQIQDQIGARVVTFYLKDVERVAEKLSGYFRPIEQKSLEPNSESEFGYVGKHFIFFLPNEMFDGQLASEKAPQFFELQIKTLFQHAWSEANHDLGYKPSSSLNVEQKRRIAFTAAQAWGADWIFDELHSETSD